MKPRPPALIVLNPAAHGGDGTRRYATIDRDVTSQFDATLVVADDNAAWINDVHAALGRGVRIFIAGGGDGTVHTLLNALVEAPDRPPLASITLGAIGLGSSNDFLKPVRTRIGNVPVRLDVAHGALHDVVRCRYTGGAGTRTVCFLVSASLGVTACANAIFSDRTWLARALRKSSTPLAIAWAATRTVAAWRGLPAELKIDKNAPEYITLCSLNVLKTEWLSGHLRFGHAAPPDSGDLDIALSTACSRARLVADILALLRGRFDGRPGHRRLRARTLDIRLDRESPLELDGEIDWVHAVRFDLHPERIHVCT